MRQEKTGSERFDRKPYKSLLLVVASTLLIAFVILMVNQAAQLVRLGLDIHPTLGRSLLVFFILLSFGIVLMTAILLTRLEKPLVVPDSQDQPGYDLFLRQLGKRLRQNRYLKQNTFLWDEEADRLGQIEAALTVLDQESQRLIRQTAAAVFVTTAVSQNGTLDGLFVLMSALRLVWQLALLYHQRPAIRDLIKLYTNIFGTVLLTRQIDDLDLIADQLEPVMATLFGGTLSALVPGATFAVTFVANSVLEGSLNAMLMLRVGLITQAYCRSLVRKKPRAISQAASVEACRLLGVIVKDNAARVSKSLLRAIKKAGVNTVQQGKDLFGAALDKILHRTDASGHEDPRNETTQQQEPAP